MEGVEFVIKVLVHGGNVVGHVSGAVVIQRFESGGHGGVCEEGGSKEGEQRGYSRAFSKGRYANSQEESKVLMCDWMVL